MTCAFLDGAMARVAIISQGVSIHGTSGGERMGELG